MRKNKNKWHMILFIFLLAIIFLAPNKAFAESINSQNQTFIEFFSKDDITVMYRRYKGKYQYRRWNKTKNKWVDSHWITIG
ncbi:MAG: hypothetical protein FRC54_03575 [bacterium LCO1.1]|uniref:Uncharacterized protein n=1 Tax=Candidatus Weimeria bifida TaxID=2599074 RepID=A0A6N7IXT0_9FIRM|nr:hypothetical protein [Candidatus Weimeria bifida]